MVSRLSAAVGLLIVCASARLSADLIITWKSTTAQGPAASADSFTEKIRAARQREDHGDDLKPGTSAYSVIRDLAEAREYLLWHGFKQYRETVMKTVAERTKGRAPARPHETPALDVKPRSETRTIGGLTCHGYDVTSRTAGGGVALNGTFWVAPNGKGVAEYQRFYKHLRNFSPVTAATVKPGREEVQGIREEREAFLAAAVDAGFPCLVDYELKGLNRTWRFTREVVNLSTSRVRPQALAIPSDYRRVRVR